MALSCLSLNANVVRADDAAEEEEGDDGGDDGGGAIAAVRAQMQLKAKRRGRNNRGNDDDDDGDDDDGGDGDDDGDEEDSEEEYYYISFDEVIDSVEEIFDPSHVLTFTVNPHEKFCFYEEITELEIAEAHLQKTSTIEGAMFVSGGRNRDIEFEIFGPDAESIHKDLLKKEGGFSVPMTKEGTYEFCLSNLMSVRSSKKITLALHFEKPKAAPEYLQTEDLLPVGVASDAVYSKLNQVNKELRFMQLRSVLSSQFHDDGDARQLSVCARVCVRA